MWLFFFFINRVAFSIFYAFIEINSRANLHETVTKMQEANWMNREQKVTDALHLHKEQHQQYPCFLRSQSDNSIDTTDGY